MNHYLNEQLILNLNNFLTFLWHILDSVWQFLRKFLASCGHGGYSGLVYMPIPTCVYVYGYAYVKACSIVSL